MTLVMQSTSRALVSGATVNDDGGVTFVEDEIGQDANDPTPAAGRGIALWQASYRVKITVISLPTRSWMATGASQHGQSPPMPSGRQYLSQTSQRCTPK
jgi:hypothetical protein